MSSTNKELIENWIQKRGLKNIFKGTYKHLDYKPALRNKDGNKIPYPRKTDIGILNQIFIDTKRGRVNILDFLESFLSGENIQKRKFLPFLLAKKPKVKVTWYKSNRSDKGNKKIKWDRPRPIMWASHFDALIYRFFCYLWGNNYEKFIQDKGLEKNVIAYRSIYDEQGKYGKNNINFAQDSFEYIKSKKDVLAIVLDISKFFENLDHKILKKNLEVILETDRLSDLEFLVFKRLTKYAYVEQVKIKDKIKAKRKILCTPQEMRELQQKKELEININGGEKGIPQGSPLSGLLANIYMIFFDEKVREICGDDVFYSRYSDDIILIGEEKKVTYTLLKLKELVKTLVKLEIKDEKTKKAFFKNGICIKSECQKNKRLVSNIINPRLEYLGCEFNGIDIGIKSGSLSRYYQKLARTIRKYRFARNAKKIITRRSTYPTKSGKRNFGVYIRSALSRVLDNNFIKKQFSRHTKFIKKGLLLPKFKKPNK